MELNRRQQAVVDRAVRLYRHRVLAGTQRAVLRRWRALVDSRRAVVRSAAVSFVHAYLAVWRRKVFAAWLWCDGRGCQATALSGMTRVRKRKASKSTFDDGSTPWES